MSESRMLFDQLDRRARLMRGVRYAGVLSACIAGLSLMAAATSAIVVRPISHFWLIVAAGLLLISASGFVLGYRLPLRLSRTLIRADVALGLEATLSTLNDIQHKPEMRLFSNRIEAKLPSPFPLPREAFPVGWKEASLLGTAIVLVSISFVVAAIPSRAMHREIQTSAAIGSVVGLPESLVVEASSEMSGQRMQTDTGLPDATSAPDTTETLTLGDILTTIRSAPATVTSSEAEIDEASLRPRQTPELTLEEVLRQIEEHLVGDVSESLSATETEILEAYRDSAKGELAERLERILDSSSHDEILDQVSQILADPALADAIPGSELPTVERDTIQVAQVGSDVENDSAPLMFDTSSEQVGELVIVETTLPSSTGDEGDYTYYLTKGVPIEPPSEATALSDQEIALSYQQLETIALSRSLDPDVLDTIKAYFDRIARGGS
ncbi:MAG: hypothetical protein E4H08_03850 [Candidatus Atribacteria bacterium]|nr:MAG: hypothetical protein E4H08_03850 [Candidatus Atribacteria bacterium]